MQKKEMSRGTMTAWICGTLVAIGAIAGVVYASQPDPNDRWAECRDFFGNLDTMCAAEVSAERLRGYPR